MINAYELSKQINNLQQCLSANRPLGFFLGAGCPMAIRLKDDKSQPLIPDIAGITTEVCKQLSESSDCNKLIETVNKNFEIDGRSGPTVEDILTHIRSLRAVAGREKIRGLSAEDLDRLDEEICSIIYNIVNRTLPSNNTPYHKMAVWIDAFDRADPVEVFTTNYDLLMEQAFEDCQVSYFDGFVGSREPFFDIRAMEEDKLPSRWAHLWKLHGSINWYQDSDKRILRNMTNKDCVKRVIYPSHQKYDESRRMPYLAMMDRLRAFFKKSEAVLMISGYSFRDEHINEIIIQGLRCTQTATTFALLYGDLTDYPKAIKLALERTNLSLLAQDGAIISGQKCQWMEKEEEEGSIESDKELWLEWSPPTKKDNKMIQKALFKLGDFHTFGKFLLEVVGPNKAIVGV